MSTKRLLSIILPLLIITFLLSSCVQQNSFTYTPEEAFNTVVVYCDAINQKLKSLEYPCIDISNLKFNGEKINILHTIEFDEYECIDIEFNSTAYIDETGKQHNGEVYFYVRYNLSPIENTTFDTVLFAELSNCVSNVKLSSRVCDNFIETDELSDFTSGGSDGIKVSKLHYLDKSHASELKYTEMTKGHKFLTYFTKTQKGAQGTFLSLNFKNSNQSLLG